ncbi:MAG: hypothetical protein A3I09_01960 [Deltaproteobacteria bacterium RIFCSPLOWO2_02_FULL_47_10]|nr:MAG: hypothetical protein A3I09_01960 [Deltaproteobacteria bacterium RIFCSPLOWO2_02_FULL_47_10]
MNVNGVPTPDEIKKYAIFWHDSAIDNMKTAESLLHSKRYNFAMFMCQQTLEAILKCVFLKLKAERPPFIHKLPRLLTMSGLKVPLWLDKIILRVDAHYIKARYFNDRFDLQIYNRKNASELIEHTRKVLQWFVKELKLKE